MDIGVIWKLRKIPFDAVLRHYNIRIPRHSGRQYKVYCPFHSETRPSFNVNPSRNLSYCFGCNEGWDTIKFIRQIESCRFHKALEVLADIGGYRVDAKLLKEISESFGGVWNNPQRLKEVYEARRQEAWSKMTNEMIGKLIALFQSYEGWKDFASTYVDWLWEEYDMLCHGKMTTEKFDAIKDWYRRSVKFIKKEAPRWVELKRMKRKVWEERVGRI